MKFADKLYRAYDSSFLHEIASIPGGEQITSCIQCGTCSGSCPTSSFMDHTPRKLFAMIRAGMRDEVLSSNAIWYCVSCYNCYVRCPKDIKITDVIYALKNLSLQENKYPSEFKSPKLAKQFLNTVSKYGRSFEMGMTANYFLRADWPEMLRNASTAMKLLSHKRVTLTPHKIKGIDQLKKIEQTVKKMGGA